MKKTTLALFLALGLVARAQQEKEPAVTAFRLPGAALPALKAVDTKGKAHSASDFEGEGYFFLVMFNPTCGDCLDMGELFARHADTFKGSAVLFLAGPQMGPYLSNYAKSTGLDQKPQMVVGRDSLHTIEKLYEYRALPQINVYDREHRLAHTFFGYTPLDSLRPYLVPIKD